MDYTTVAQVKAALGTTEVADDAILATTITAASRAIDKHCTGAVQAADNYFELGNVANEQIWGVVDQNGALVCWPRKPIITAISALSYRASPREDWTAVNLSWLNIDGGQVAAWLGLADRSPRWVKISYTGGLADSAASLPADLIEAATVLTIRFYRESKSGLTDTIGVAELGMLIYTKALPIRVVEMLRPYKRVVSW
jgi:hypothetical protein